MYFELNPYVLAERGVARRVDHVVRQVSDYLGTALSGRQYGQGIERFGMGVWCQENPMPGFEEVLADGRVYSQSSKGVHWAFCVGYSEVVSAGTEELVQILRRGILETKNGVEALGIKKFDTDVFYRDLDVLLQDKSWLKDPKKYERKPADGPDMERSAPDVRQEEARIPAGLMMAEKDFWALIRESMEAGDGTIRGELAHLEDRLAGRSEKEIVGFELTLRELIRRSYHHNVVALLKAIADYVSDDTLLYFQCRLILYGRDLFYQAIKDPNKLTERLDDGMGEGEGLLLVADNAFLRKFGQDTDRALPRDVASTYYDYDLAGPVLGKPWTERTFAKRYAALLKLYQ